MILPYLFISQLQIRDLISVFFHSISVDTEVRIYTGHCLLNKKLLPGKINLPLSLKLRSSNWRTNPTSKYSGTMQFTINDYTITIKEKQDHRRIAKCRNQAISAIQDLRKMHVRYA